MAKPGLFLFLFSFFSNDNHSTNLITIDKRQMVYLGLEPPVARWQTQTNPLSYVLHPYFSVFKCGHFQPHYSSFCIEPPLALTAVGVLTVTGFELWISGLGSDRSMNCATTTLKSIYKNMGQSRTSFLFTFVLNSSQFKYKLKKAQLLCLRIKPRVSGLSAKTDPLSYGGLP